MDGVIHPPGFQAYRSDGMLFILVRQAELLGDHEVYNRVSAYLDHLEGNLFKAISPRSKIEPFKSLYYPLKLVSALSSVHRS